MSGWWGKDTHGHVYTCTAMKLGSGGVLLILPPPGPCSLSMLIRYSTGGGVTSLGRKSLEEQAQAVTSPTPTPQEQEASCSPVLTLISVSSWTLMFRLQENLCHFSSALPIWVMALPVSLGPVGLEVLDRLCSCWNTHLVRVLLIQGFLCSL